MSWSGVFIFLPLCLLGLCTRVTGTSSNNPVIIPNREFVTGEAGSNWTISCRGSHPVTWYFHEDPLDYGRDDDDDDRVSIIEGRDDQQEFPYSADIFIFNVSTDDQGAYYCYYKNDTRSEFYDFIHLRVNRNEWSTADLLVGADHKLQTVNAYIGMPAKLPCKPARRNVHVVLSNEHGEWTPNVPGSRLLYNETEGYTIDSVTLTDQGPVFCRGTLGDEKPNYIDIFVTVSSSVPVIEKPTIDATKADAIGVGSDFSLICAFNASPTTLYKINWTNPVNVIDSGRANIKLNCKGTSGKKCEVTLSVTNARKEDSGVYVCNVILQQTTKSVNHTVMIYGQGDEFLNATTQSTDIQVHANKTAQWVITMDGYPSISEYTWERASQPKGIKIGEKYKIVVNKSSREIVLRIIDAQLSDTGQYHFIVTNGLKTVNLSLSLTVNDKPQFRKLTSPTGGDFYQYAKVYTFECEINGYPYPNVSWAFQKCSFNDENCHYNEFKEIESFSRPYDLQSRRGTKSEATFIALEHGYLDVEAKNSLAKEPAIDGWEMKIIDFEDTSQTGFSITGNVNPVDRTQASYTCSVTNIHFKESLIWGRQKNDQVELFDPSVFHPEMTVTSNSSKWSYQSHLVIHSVQMQDSGEYFCRANALNGTSQYRTVQIKVLARISADFNNDTNLNDATIRYQAGDETDELICKAEGLPVPTITWFKDDVPSDEWPKVQQKMLTIINENESRLKLISKPEYSGKYTCKVVNDDDGGKERFVFIEIESIQSISMAGIITMALLGSVVVILLILLGIKLYKDRKNKLFLIDKRRTEFMQGATENINPELPVHDQVNLLPYYDTWEFPKENLKLGMMLGSGAFGQVVKAEAFGIVDCEPTTTVAVKMVKPNANDSHVNALVSELKIMVHLGRHVNVVNLLGACTKNLAKKGELLVIVEYCKYGSLLSYLHRHKNDFVDQLDPITGLVDTTILPLFEDPSARLNYAALTFTENRANRMAANGYRFLEVVSNDSSKKSSTGPVSYNPADDYDCNNVKSVCTDMSYVSNSVVGTDGRRGSSSSWNGQHYRGDYQQREAPPITTTEILCWAFQIARGMEYLSSRKVLHGDLAARNVLLADNNIVKICDFGLAKELYKDNYKKKTEGILPVKWMSPESIYYGVFSSQSDVWSFAVTVWELFSLGKSPYPGMDADVKFCTMLNDGYRMERPPYAPLPVYDLMKECWNHDSSERPSFSSLAEQLGNLIETGLRQRYIDLNENYCRMNQDWLVGKEDYLLQMGVADLVFDDTDEKAGPTYVNVTPMSPDYLQPRKPGDVDEEFPKLQQLANNAGYVFMNSRPSSHIELSSGVEESHEIFSPRPIPDSPPSFHCQDETTENNQSFNFNDKILNVPHELVEVRKSNEGNVSPLPYIPPDLSSSPLHEFQGVSNINYVPNNLILAPKASVFCDNLNNELCNDGDFQDSRDLSNHKNNGRNSKRQKNDSGISSIGSNHEHSTPINDPNQKFPPPFYYENNQLANILVNGHESE